MKLKPKKHGFLKRHEDYVLTIKSEINNIGVLLEFDVKDEDWVYKDWKRCAEGAMEANINGSNRDSQARSSL